ncbi:MAG: hypothetical protein AAB954_02470 [Patescibacteria group bacterium]
MKKLPNNSSGQALLLVLLSMSVVLTIVLSILARSTLDINVSSQSEESVRAFSAAEAGIEQALVVGSTGDVDVGNATFNAEVTAFSSAASEFILPSSLYSGESATVWFVSHDANGNLTCNDGTCFTGNQLQVCWGKAGTPDNSATTPAIEVSIVYLSIPGNYTTAKIAREVIDPNTARRSSNSFTAPNNGACQVNSQTFPFKKTLNLASLGIPAASFNFDGGLQLARLAILYNTDMGHPVSVNVSFGGNSALPSQGTVIDSSGVSGGSTRRVEVVRGFKELPDIFETVVFSQGGITL